MQEWRGAPVAQKIQAECMEQMKNLPAGIVPTLGIIRVGAAEDDVAYERGIRKRFEAVGANVVVKELPADVSQQKLEETLYQLNIDDQIHGILVFNPLPKHLDIIPLRDLIDPKKDIDGLGWINLSYVYAGDKRAYPPCTAAAVVEMLDFYDVDLQGKDVTIIGRSLVVGKPLGALLTNRNATITMCHTKTRDVPQKAKQGDILVASCGVKKLVDQTYMKDGQIVIDVGIHEDGDHLCGDVDTSNLPELFAITPVPGGVGAVTTSILLKHVVMATTNCI